MKIPSILIKNLTATFIVVVLLISGVGCKKDTPDKIGAVKNRTLIPKLHAQEVTTVISDSGITKYRIYTKQWDVYDKAAEPYWNFPKGLHFERFNEDLVVDANIHANRAKYFDRKRLWELRGKVKAINLMGEMFETEHLYWDQMQERIYSDTLIKVTQKTRIITGVGFESNQSMTKYSILKIKGIMLIPD